MDPLAPPVPLQDHCSIIKDNILYVYSPDAFQSIPLQDGGKWSQLKNGVSVSGARCVRGGDASNGDALWIVGGTAQNPNYPGLQKYSFITKTWETITPVTAVTKNRQSHAAAYLQDSGSLLVYGGSQSGPNVPSIETFSISVLPPYSVESYTSKNTPVTSPVLLPWNSSGAVCMGGLTVSNEANLQVYYFDMQRGWRRYGRPLANNPSGASKQSTLVQGSDGSVVLSTFDMGVSPNQVSQVLLEKPNGRPARKGQTVGEPPKKRRKRDLSVNDWPVYNNTFAPTASRTGFSLAQGTNGLVAITGGSSGRPLVLFNEDRNSWVNTSQFFGTPVYRPQRPLRPSSTGGSISPTSTSGSTGIPTVDGDHPKTSLILGATLGSILGFVALLIIVLLLIRHKRQKKRAAMRTYEDNEKQRLSFADRGAPFMMEAGGTGIQPPQTANSSVIMNGQYNPHHQRNISTRGSESSTSRLVPNNGLGHSEAMEMEIIEENRLSALKPNGNGSGPTSDLLGLPKPKRTSGWSRYFSGNDAAAVAAGASSDPRKSDLSSSRKSIRSLKSMRSSQPSSYATSIHDCNTHGPTEIPPLNLGQQFQGRVVSKMVVGESDSNRNSQLPTESARRSSEPPPRPSTVESTLPPSFDFSSHGASDENSTWTPITRSDWTNSIQHRDTVTSSIYSQNDAPIKPISSNPINSAASKPVSTIKTVSSIPRMSDAVYSSRQERPISVVPERDSMIYDEDENDHVEIVSGHHKAQAAQTAIPIPAGTIMSTKINKSASSSEPANSLDWVKLGP